MSPHRASVEKEALAVDEHSANFCAQHDHEEYELKVREELLYIAESRKKGTYKSRIVIIALLLLQLIRTEHAT